MGAYNVYFFRELNLLNGSVDERDPVDESVCATNILGQLDDKTLLDGIDLAGTGLASKHGMNASSSADIQNGFPAANGSKQSFAEGLLSPNVRQQRLVEF